MVLRLALLATLVMITSSAGAQECIPEKRVALSLSFGTNRTGHPRFDVHLQQPTEIATGQLDVELATSSCGPGAALRKVLKLSLNGGSTAQKNVPPGYSIFPGLGHFRRPENALSWDAARELCVSEGAMLALPATQREMDELLKVFTTNASGTQNSQYMWVGASDNVQEGKFVTTTGVAVDQATTIKHPTSQLIAGTGENCLLYHAGNKDLHDWPCPNKLGFFCKVEQ